MSVAVWACLNLLLLDTVRQQNRTAKLWMETAKMLEAAYNFQVDSFETQKDILVNLANETVAFRQLLTQIATVESFGWMWSLGMMNTHRRTGPTVFLWKSEVHVEDGKVRVTVHKGEGETFFIAFEDAMIKAGVEWADQ